MQAFASPKTYPEMASYPHCRIKMVSISEKSSFHTDLNQPRIGNRENLPPGTALINREELFMEVSVFKKREQNPNCNKTPNAEGGN